MTFVLKQHTTFNNEIHFNMLFNAIQTYVLNYVTCYESIDALFTHLFNSQTILVWLFSEIRQHNKSRHFELCTHSLLKYENSII